MAKPQKFATLQEAIEIHARGDEFVYNNPCSKCKKECSTPTLAIWKARIELFGGVKEMYEGYVCRDCRKKEKGDAPKKDKALPQPVVVHVPVKRIEEIPVLDANVNYVTPPAPKPVDIFAEPPKENLPTIVVAPVRKMPQPGDKIFTPPGKIGFTVWELESGKLPRWTGTHFHDIG